MKKKIGIISGTIIVSLLPIAEYLIADCYQLKKFNLYMPVYSGTAFYRPHIFFILIFYIYWLFFRLLRAL